MNIVEAVIIGIVQGVAEWLPVSSEAVITLILTALGSEPGQALNASIFLHTGTMVAAFIYFRKEYFEIIRYVLEKLRAPRKTLENPEKILEERNGKLAVFLAVSTVLTGLVGGAIYFLGLKTAVENPTIFYILMSAALFLTGLLRLYSRSESREYSSVNLKDSIFVGFLQGFSIIPGVSRSGTTAFGFLFRDFDARDAFHLSFLMSVPAVAAGSIGLELFTEFSFQPMYLVSAAVAGVVGYLTIDAVLEIADRAEIAWVCFGLGLLALVPALI
ncbi:MAG: undecaprenyl-diphosphate phosphatase [Candidatus Nanohalobium sp.]